MEIFNLVSDQVYPPPWIFFSRDYLLPYSFAIPCIHVRVVTHAGYSIQANITDGNYNYI